MSDSPAPVGALAEVSTTHVTLRYRPGSFAAGRIEELAERAEQVARLVARRLKPTRAPGRRPARVVLTLIDEPPVDGRDSTDEGLFATAHLVPVAAETPVRLIGDRTALVMIRDAAGGPSFWTPLADVAHAPAIRRALEFLGLGLARYLASRAENEPSRLFGGTVRGEAPLQSADQVVRQVAADRDGKVPLYECLMRGPTLASPPEYLALAESFCGYLFEREGPKAYFRFVQGTRQDVSVAADVRYGKNIEGLIDEWLGAVLRGQVRRPVTLNEFFRQILPYLRPYKWPLTLIFILIFLSSGVSQILPFQVRDITDLLVSEPARLPSNVQLPQDLWGAATAGEPSWAEVGSRHSRALDTLTRVYAKLGIAFVAFFVGATAIVWLIYLVNVVGQNILRDLRLMLTTRLHHLGAGFYARNRMGDMVVRFTSDIPRMADPLVDTVAYSVYHVVFLLWTVWAMFQMSWQLSMLLFFIVPVYFFSSRRLGPAIQRASRTRQERLSQLNANLEEMLFGHSVIKSYGLGGHLMTGFRPKVQEFRKVAIWTDFLRAIYTQFIRTVDNLTTKMVWALGASLIVFQVVTLGTLTGFNLLMGRFINPLHALSGIYAGISVAAASLRRVEEVLREPMEVMNVPPGGSYAPEGVAEAITFEDVNFSYTGAEPTLIDINLTIPAGSKVAFVGPTGAGKSTLASLIPRFYDVDQGAIRIDGRDIREFSLAGLRQSISIVSQDTFLFNSTILENIRLGRLDASDEDVIEAAKGARLHSFIETLSAGYDTLVGERGWRLSGGQKQRVAIARALLRNSPIMILDEATSALDAETEAQILGELDDVTKGKTVISITHRLGLALKSEKICVLQAGRIIQQGSHEELIQQAGLYRKLFEDQNRDLVRRAQGEQLDFTTQRVQSVPIFGLVPSEQIDHSVHVLRTEHYAAGDTFVPQEGAANDLYVLRSGQIELIVEDGKNGGQRLTIGAPRNGEGPSSMSLLLSVPHSVSARVLADAELHVLRGDDLRSLLGGAWLAPAPGNGEAAQAAASVGLVPG